MSKKDGGPAFPQDVDWQETVDGFVSTTRRAGGMSLRDYFAGQALTGWAMNKGFAESPSCVADCAYRYADAMLAEREK